MRPVLVRLPSLPLLVAGLMWLVLTGTAGAQGPTGTMLELYLPSGGAVGQEIAVDARLRDAAGAAVAGAEVVFQRDVSFMNAGGRLELGRAITDEEGWASLSFTPRSEGEMSIRAQFGGNDQYGPASTSDTVPIQTGPPLYVEEAGVRVPGINVSLLAGVLGAVWGTYFVVMGLIWRIARAGAGPTTTSGVPHE